MTAKREPILSHELNSWLLGLARLPVRAWQNKGVLLLVGAIYALLFGLLFSIFTLPPLYALLGLILIVLAFSGRD